MEFVPDGVEPTLAERIEGLVDGLEGRDVTVQELLEVLGREGLLVACAFLALPFLVPVSVPGVSSAFGAVVALIGVALLTQRPPWLPARLRRRRLSVDALRPAMRKGAVWLRRLGRFARPTLPALTRGPVAARAHGLTLVVSAALLMVPFGFVPLSNTLPGLALLLLSIGMVQRDGRAVLAGYAAIAASALYFGFLALGGASVLRLVLEGLRAG